MTAFLERMESLAQGLVDRYGVPMTVTRLSRSYDASAREVTESSTVHSCKGVLRSFVGAERVEEAREVSRFGAVVGNFTTQGFRPRVDDILTVEGRQYRINSVTPLRPAGVDILWQLGLDDAA